ncbi:hypothetical protein BGZ75_003464 [Mortierella antarctica]|nr:hypothetical protein BGZ67_004462 [Mortierella alpina]KAF9990137.1 hypothetical protein BGZ75_003464 [Mortierella antarctica]
MSMLRLTPPRLLASARATGAAPAAALLPHWTRPFSSSSQNHKKMDVIKSAPGWQEELASESEADVKADREPMPRDIHQLQYESVKAIREKHHSSMEDAAQTLKHDFDKAARELNKEVKRFGQEMGQTKDQLKNEFKNKGEEGFKTMKGFERKVEGVKTHMEHSEDSVMDEVKAGAQRMTNFMKESLDTVKKTVGLGAASGTSTTEKSQQYRGSKSMQEDKIKQKVKNVDDKVDNDRGA